MKKTFWAVLAIAVVSFMSMGCFTTMLWQDKSYDQSFSPYKESIESFMMTQDGSKIIFVSKDYHYILNSVPSLAFLLSHKDNLPVAYEFSKGTYTITSNHVTNNYAKAVFHAKIDLAQCDPSLAKEMLDNHYGTLDANKKILSFSFTLGGTRYQSDSKINDKLTKIETPIPLTITEIKSVNNVGQTVKKIALTPLAIAADGVTIVIGAGALAIGVITLPITIPMFAILDSNNKHK